MNQFNSEVEALEHCDKMDALHPEMPVPVQVLIDMILSVTAPGAASVWSWWSRYRTQKSRENMEEYIHAIRAEINKQFTSQNDNLENFRSRIEKVEEDRLSLILIEGLRRSEQSSTRERARRLGKVAVSGIVRFPKDSLEKVTEFLRFAEELSETDILVLREMHKAQARCNPDRFQSARADDVRNVMNAFQVNLPGGKQLDYAYVKSSFARLQSLGLAIQLSSQSNTSPEKLPLELLRLGSEFLEYIVTST